MDALCHILLQVSHYIQITTPRCYIQHILGFGEALAGILRATKLMVLTEVVGW